MENRIASMLGSDHREIDVLFDEVFTALGSADHDAALQKLDLFWARLAIHIRAEHLHLFPALSRLAETAHRDLQLPGFPEVIDLLRQDHNEFMSEIARAMKVLRSLTADGRAAFDLMATVGNSMNAVRSRLERHNQIEEEKVYSLLKLLSDGGEAEELEQNIRRELANLPPRFAGPRAAP